MIDDGELGKSLSRQDFYSHYAPCILGIETEGEDGEISFGTAFHVGDGYLVTARHVVEKRKVISVVVQDGRISVASITPIFPANENIDLALLKSDFSLATYMSDQVQIMVDGRPAQKQDHIEIGGHLDDWIGDSMVLMNVVVFGFPPIPTSRGPVLVAAKGEVNAVIDPYIGSPHPLFIVSPITRGGFSGGPVLTEGGWLLGVMTSSLITNNAPAEYGYGAAITVEPLLALLAENGIYPGVNGELMHQLGF